MQTTKDPGPERFVTVEQCRQFGDQKLNIEHLARLVVFEAMQPESSLRLFLKKRVLFGNYGEITLEEIRDLGREIFLSERSKGYLAQLRSDNCIGYTADEVGAITTLLASPHVTDIDAALLLGYIPPRRRY